MSTVTHDKQIETNFSGSEVPHSPLTPGTLRVIKRNGQSASYDESKIRVAMAKAFLAVEGDSAAVSSRVHEIVTELAQQISAIFMRRLPGGGTVHIEDIQDQVELALMRNEHHKIARAYVLYREERRRIRQAQQHSQQGTDSTINIIFNHDKKIPLSHTLLTSLVENACRDLAEVDGNIIVEDTLRALFEGAEWSDVEKALVLSARTLIEREPNYSFVAARLLLNTLYREALTFLNVAEPTLSYDMSNLYSVYFQHYLNHGVEQELIDPRLLEFDLAKISQALKPERDFKFTYLGLQTLYDRYFLHTLDTRFELPQSFFMRVAMGLALNEQEDRTEHAIEFYNILSTFDFMSSTPTLFNSGTLRPQLSSCFLTTVPDDLDGIYSAIKDNALLSKFAGGLGNDWTYVRGMNSRIKGTNGKSLGVVPFLNVVNASAVAVNQGGKRKGAICGYLEAWHIDIEEFLELRKNTGDDRRRTHDMNTAIWVPDLLLKRVFQQEDWTLFSPDETADLHDCYGLNFEKTYLAYEEKARKGEIKNSKKIPALNLWRKMLSMLYETGHPWITFKDPCNLRSPQQHAGVIHSSNLCTEITLNTSFDEIAVCNLGSINLVAHLNEKGIDHQKLERTVTTAVRMLDNVIDINYYTVPQAKRSNLRHRPVGLGLMGFQDALHQLKLNYASNDAVEFADRSMEAISYYAISASAKLAEERGAYESFKGSLWNQGILPIDSIELLQKARGDYLEQDRSQTMDWKKVRERAKKGMRNSNVMAIAPTATISNICGVSASIEPTFQNIFVKSNLSGEFTVINPYLVADLKALNLWDAVMVNDLKYYDGSVQKIERIPLELKQRYATAFEIDPQWLIEAGSRRQKWIDQSQSLNLYVAEPSGKKLDSIYKLAWVRGLKTTYYLRSLGASSAEKSTVHDGALNAVRIDELPKACSITDPGCESCQ